MGLGLLCLGILFSFTRAAADVETISLPAKGEISRAEVFIWRENSDRNRAGDAAKLKGVSGSSFRGALVLCPRQNGSSERLIRDKRWQGFARDEGLALVGIRFVSSDEDLKDGRGYFVASRGSGELLEEGLERAGLGDVPLLLYGFSGGAHFAMSFAAWRPERVMGFCAYSFAWWAAPPEELRCPAVIACGQADGTRYGSSLAYFQSGRSQGKPWVWVSLKEKAHAPSAELDDFVRAYFSCVLEAGERGDRSGLTVGKRGESRTSVPLVLNRTTSGTLVLHLNMTEEIVAGRGEAKVATSVLPCRGLLPKWREVHYP